MHDYNPICVLFLLDKMLHTVTKVIEFGEVLPRSETVAGI